MHLNKWNKLFLSWWAVFSKKEIGVVRILYSFCHFFFGKMKRRRVKRLIWNACFMVNEAWSKVFPCIDTFNRRGGIRAKYANFLFPILSKIFVRVPSPPHGFGTNKDRESEEDRSVWDSTSSLLFRVFGHEIPLLEIFVKCSKSLRKFEFNGLKNEKSRSNWNH